MNLVRLNGLRRNFDRQVQPGASSRGPVAISLREKSKMKGRVGDLHRQGGRGGVGINWVQNQ